jgi:hypothetical protein
MVQLASKVNARLQMEPFLFIWTFISMRLQELYETKKVEKSHWRASKATSLYIYSRSMRSSHSFKIGVHIVKRHSYHDWMSLGI